MNRLPFRPRRARVAAACLLASVAAVAQTTPTTRIDPVVVTGNPLGRDDATRPAAVLGGEALLLRRAGTLGETLDGLPGVAGSGFGANASRPVIRGLDGDRIRLLDNGAGLVDASNLSFDHAVAVDPLVVERIEVLRGPAALLYGGNAAGGVVSVLDNRIPREAAAGLAGRAELRLGGAASERAGAVVLDGGAGALAWHADVASRHSGDLRTPRFTPMADGQPLEPANRVRNSASSSRAGAVGGGWASASGYAGVSLDRLDHDYGVTVEPDVTIRLLRERAAFAGEWRALPGPLASLSLKASRTRYAHEEVEGSGEVGTRFASTGDEWRAELRHKPLGGLEGVLGMQSERLDFSALGEEAFVPGIATRSDAVFLLEEFKLGSATFSAGLRRERVSVASDGDAPDAADPRFGEPRSRRFTPGSASLAVRLDLGGGWQASGSLGRTERAPAYYELYANGLHLATAAFEIGDPDLGPERSRHVEFGLAFRRGGERVSVNVFSTRFARYIALRDTGNVVVIPAEDPGEPDTEVPEYRFEGVRARLTGAEVEAATTLALAGAPLQLSATLDLVRGDDLDRNEPLPRLPPLRLRVGAAWTLGSTTLGADVRHAARQGRVPATDTATPAATVLDLWARGRIQALPGLGWYAKLSNLTDELAFNAAAVAAVRGLSPAAGRAFAAGVQWRW
ncbi:MAG: TonB-dependent receptor [Betaproteobacteria bacterium]